MTRRQELGSSPRQSATDGSHRTTKLAGRQLMGHSLQVTKHQGCAEPLGKSSEFLLDHDGGFIAIECVFGRGAATSAAVSHALRTAIRRRFARARAATRLATA